MNEISISGLAEFYGEESRIKEKTSKKNNRFSLDRMNKPIKSWVWVAEEWIECMKSMSRVFPVLQHKNEVAMVKVFSAHSSLQFAFKFLTSKFYEKFQLNSLQIWTKFLFTFQFSSAWWWWGTKGLAKKPTHLKSFSKPETWQSSMLQ